MDDENRIGQRRAIPKTIAGTTLDLDAGFAAMQRAVAAHFEADDAAHRAARKHLGRRP